MKAIPVLLLVLLFSTFSRADIECTSKDPVAKVTVIEVYDGGPTTLTVESEHTVIYANVAVAVIQSGELRTYQSPTFKNSNGAPSELSLEVSEVNRKLNGVFSEMSYLPRIGYLSLDCEAD